MSNPTQQYRTPEPDEIAQEGWEYFSPKRSNWGPLDPVWYGHLAGRIVYNLELLRLPLSSQPEPREEGAPVGSLAYYQSEQAPSLSSAELETEWATDQDSYKNEYVRADVARKLRQERDDERKSNEHWHEQARVAQEGLARAQTLITSLWEQLVLIETNAHGHPDKITCLGRLSAIDVHTKAALSLIDAARRGAGL